MNLGTLFSYFPSEVARLEINVETYLFACGNFFLTVCVTNVALDSGLSLRA